MNKNQSGRSLHALNVQSLCRQCFCFFVFAFLLDYYLDRLGVSMSLLHCAQKKPGPCPNVSSLPPWFLMHEKEKDKCKEMNNAIKGTVPTNTGARTMSACRSLVEYVHQSDVR